MIKPRNIGNILSVSSLKISHQLKDDFGLEYNLWEEIDDDKTAWTLIFGKRRTSPYTFIFYHVHEENINELTLIEDLNTKPYGKDIPVVIVLEDDELREQLKDSNVPIVSLNNQDMITDICNTVFETYYPDGISLFNIRENADHTIFTFPNTLSAKVVEELKERVTEIVNQEDSKITYLFNFKNLIHYNQNEIRELYLQLKEMNDSGVSYASIFLSALFSKDIKQRGIEAPFHMLPTYKSAVAKFRLSSDKKREKSFPRINVDLINPFLDSTMAILKDLTGHIFTNEKPKNYTSEELTKDFSATINLGNEKSKLLIALNFTRETFLSLITQIQAKGHLDQAEDISNLLNSILNQVFRSGKSELKRNDIEIDDAELEVINQKEVIQGLFNESFNIGVSISSQICQLILSITPS